MADNELRRTVMKREGGSVIAELVGKIDCAVRAAYGCKDSKEERDIIGYTQISFEGCSNKSLGYYVTYAKTGSGKHYNAFSSFFYPVAGGLCNIKIVLSIADPQKPEDEAVADEIAGRITKELIEAIPEQDAEGANTATVRQMIMSQTKLFTLEMIHNQAEAIGICDRKLASSAFDALREEGRLVWVKVDKPYSLGLPIGCTYAYKVKI